jgi:hypothetical protein
MLLPPMNSATLSFSALFPKSAPIYQPPILNACLAAFYDYLSPGNSHMQLIFVQFLFASTHTHTHKFRHTIQNNLHFSISYLC